MPASYKHSNISNEYQHKSGLTSTIKQLDLGKTIQGRNKNINGNNRNYIFYRNTGHIKLGMQSLLNLSDQSRKGASNDVNDRVQVKQ